MKVHLVKRKTIEFYVAKNSGSRSPFLTWLNIIAEADWSIPEDIMDTYSSADLLGNGTKRVVFDIGGNNYRMICKYLFGEIEVHLFICWIGTHADYTKLCKQGKQYDVKAY